MTNLSDETIAVCRQAAVLFDRWHRAHSGAMTAGTERGFRRFNAAAADHERNGRALAASVGMTWQEAVEVVR